MNKKGIFIPPLAYALIILLIILLVIAFVPQVKQTVLEVTAAIVSTPKP